MANAHDNEFVIHIPPQYILDQMSLDEIDASYGIDYYIPVMKDWWVLTEGYEQIWWLLKGIRESHNVSSPSSSDTWKFIQEYSGAEHAKLNVNSSFQYDRPETLTSGDIGVPFPSFSPSPSRWWFDSDPLIGWSYTTRDDNFQGCDINTNFPSSEFPSGGYTDGTVKARWTYVYDSFSGHYWKPSGFLLADDMRKIYWDMKKFTNTRTYILKGGSVGCGELYNAFNQVYDKNDFTRRDYSKEFDSTTSPTPSVDRTNNSWRFIDPSGVSTAGVRFWQYFSRTSTQWYLDGTEDAENYEHWRYENTYSEYTFTNSATSQKFYKYIPIKTNDFGTMIKSVDVLVIYHAHRYHTTTNRNQPQQYTETDRWYAKKIPMTYDGIENNVYVYSEAGVGTGTKTQSFGKCARFYCNWSQITSPFADIEDEIGYVDISNSSRYDYNPHVKPITGQLEWETDRLTIGIPYCYYCVSYEPKLKVLSAWNWQPSS